MEDETLKRLLDAEMEAERMVARADEERQAIIEQANATLAQWNSNTLSTLPKSMLPFSHRPNSGRNRPSPPCNGAMPNRHCIASLSGTARTAGVSRSYCACSPARQAMIAAQYAYLHTRINLYVGQLLGLDQLDALIDHPYDDEDTRDAVQPNVTVHTPKIWIRTM